MTPQIIKKYCNKSSCKYTILCTYITSEAMTTAHIVYASNKSINLRSEVIRGLLMHVRGILNLLLVICITCDDLSGHSYFFCKFKQAASHRITRTIDSV